MCKEKMGKEKVIKITVLRKSNEFSKMFSFFLSEDKKREISSEERKNAILMNLLIGEYAFTDLKTNVEVWENNKLNGYKIAGYDLSNDIITTGDISSLTKVEPFITEINKKIKSESPNPLSKIVIEGKIKSEICQTEYRLCFNNKSPEGEGILKFFRHMLGDDEQEIYLYLVSKEDLYPKQDGKSFLQSLAESIKKNENNSKECIWLLDVGLDPEASSHIENGAMIEVTNLIMRVRELLMKSGLSNPVIIPIDLMDGQILQKVEKKLTLTQFESVEYHWLKEGANRRNLEQYALIDSELRHKLEKKLEIYQNVKDKTSEILLHTGIPVLKAVIEEKIQKSRRSATKQRESSGRANTKTKEGGTKKTSGQKLEEALISPELLPKDIKLDIKKVFPVLVMATMSSGKSTLINALLGEDILPNQNAACTAKMFAVLDDDNVSKTRIYVSDSWGNTTIKENDIKKELAKANEDSSVSSIFIQGQITGVLNTDKALLILDTPGPNNSMDTTHGDITESILQKVYGGMILYVLNATQMGINDDCNLLGTLISYCKEHPKMKVLFVLNKIDELDKERGETVRGYVLDAKQYLTSKGIKNPNIIPVSALAANLFKKVLNNVELTRLESRDFDCVYDLFEPREYNMKSYAILDDMPDQFEEVEVRGRMYKARDLMRAIDNTGIKLLEESIQKAQILSGERLRNTIKIK